MSCREGNKLIVLFGAGDKVAYIVDCVVPSRVKHLATGDGRAYCRLEAIAEVDVAVA